jgi:FMN phosphatase YigB (HAD superfamily)
MYAIWIKRRAGPSTEDQPRVQPDASVSTLAELPALLDRLQVQ